MDFALPLAVWLSRFHGSERDFWETMCPRRLNALCAAITPKQQPQPRRPQIAARDFFRGNF